MEEVDTKTIDGYLQELWDVGGSDLLLLAGAMPMVRVDGSLLPIENETRLTVQRMREIVLGMLPEYLSERLENQREVDFSFGWGPEARFRGNAFYQRGSPALALRLIPRAIPTFDELGLPPIIEHLANAPQGLVLVTGPTGSGKSTTLASMIQYVISHRACHVLTIEDPIEYFHSHGQSVVTQREIGTDSATFPRALRSALREDPDVLLVGEMRDVESIETTLTIAETGHLVFATLHTNDAAQAVDRVIDVFPGERQSQIRSQLAATLLGVVAQRLIPRIDGGRIAAFEILLSTPAVRNLIREGKTEQLRNVMVTGQRAGMNTLEASLIELIAQGVVTADAAAAGSAHPAELTGKKN